MLNIETLGEALPGTIIEAVVTPDRPSRLRFHVRSGRRYTTVSKLEQAATTYIPAKLPNAVMQIVRFAPRSLPFGSIKELVVSVREFFSTYAHLQTEALVLLVAFALATWFCDCATVAPVLYLVGPDEATSIVLRLLACVCRRSILLGDVDISSLGTFPRGLGATLLLNQRKLGPRVRQILLASTQRHFSVLRGRNHLNAYGARAFACDEIPLEKRGFGVTLSPAQIALPLLTDAEEQRLTQDLQAKLLRFRLARYASVRDREVDCKAFVPEMRQQARSWLAPIWDCTELGRVVSAELQRQSQDVSDTRLIDERCVVIEAALSLCHRAPIDHFYVGKLAQEANALLQGRNEVPNLTARGVGSKLRELGVCGKRLAKGWRVLLNDSVRERIHCLAYDYQVASLQDGLRRCPFCSGHRQVPETIS